jgi:hypothetical protein
MLTQGKVLIAGLMGDKTILQAMKSNEEDTNTAYARAVEHEDTPAQVKATLEQNLCRRAAPPGLDRGAHRAAVGTVPAARARWAGGN